MKTHLSILVLCISIISNSLTFADFPIRQSTNWDGFTVIAYNSANDEYLVVWTEIIMLGGPVMGQRVDENGNLLSGAFTISDFGVIPSVAYNSQTNEYLVAYLTTNGIYGQRVSNTGALSGSAVQLMTEQAAPKIFYNSLAGNYLLAGGMSVETPPSSGSYNLHVLTKKIQADGQPIGSSQLVEDIPCGIGNEQYKFALAYAPISTTETPYGRYILVIAGNQPIMLDSDGQVIYVVYDPYHPGVQYKYIPFTYGDALGGVFNVDVAYGMNNGSGTFLIVWGDNNNSYSNESWTGIWGNFVDPYKLDYTIDYVVQNNTFPVSAIYKHWAYGTDEYAASWKPKVAYSYPGQKFMIAWRETPSDDPLNDTKVNHIRADKVWKAITYNPNVVVSAATGNEDPKNPVIAASTLNPKALIVWEDHRNYSANDWDLYGNLYTIPAAPSITVIAPNGSENWKVGSQKNITWSCTSFSDPVKIEYSTDGGSTFFNITNSTTNDGSFTWTVPNTPSAFCIVRIKDAADGEPSDISDAVFTIYSSKKTVMNTNDSGNGSLRQAILDANTTTGKDTIAFNIPGSGPHTIQPLTQLPEISDPVVIDGYTQPGSSPNTNSISLAINAVIKIKLHGSLAGDCTGLILNSRDCLVRGLEIIHYNCGIEIGGNQNLVQGNYICSNSSGVSIGGGDSNKVGGGTPAARNLISNNNTMGVWLGKSFNIVQGNFIGTDLSGSNVYGNQVGVMVVYENNNKIGGTDTEERNIISGNTGSGISFGNGTTNNTIEGNFIGTDLTGTLPLSNAAGIYFSLNSNYNLIGGSTAGCRNIISGNTNHGIELWTDENRIEGNYIGTQADGSSPLGNGKYGVYIGENANDNTIGGTSAEAGNVIAYNASGGVTVYDSELGGSPTGNFICMNSIFNNEGLGIDLIPNGGIDLGITANDPGDGDIGGNNLQNYPFINSVENGTGTFLDVFLNSLPNTTYRIDFYSSPVGDPWGYGEGQTHIGWTESTTDANGNAYFYTSLGVIVPAGHVITATATDPDGNTSEFSAWRGSATPSNFIVTNTNNNGQGSLRQAILDANVKPGLDTIAFNIPGNGPFTIQPESVLPVISDPVVIDGYSQPGSSRNTNPLSMGNNAVLKIELDGTYTADGLKIYSGNSIVRGLIINHCHHSGIELDLFGGNIIEGNYFGTNFLNAINSVSINIYSSNNRIGGIEPAASNVISGSGVGEEVGISIREESSANTVRGNLIGTDASGMAAMGVGIGIKIYGEACYNTIGGANEGAGNIISGNDIGVVIDDSSSHNIIQGNIIGLDRTGTGKLGNDNDGIALHRCSDNNYIINNRIGGNGVNGISIVNNSRYNLISDNFIGTDESWQLNLGNFGNGIDITSACSNMIENNIIAFNNSNGIYIQNNSIGNYISRNLISKNNGKGIENTDGGNNEITPPVILSITSTEVSGTAGPGHTVEVFSDEDDEGRYYLGSTLADGAGNFSLTLSEACPYQYITATCTDESGNTSEFGQSIPVSVELISLLASASENSITISWSTGAETNNLGFDIERSNNGKDFITVGSVDGYGTTSHTQRYFFTDPNLSVGQYFYRLKQKDFDGASSVSNIIEVVIEPPQEYELSQNYPNPFNSGTIIKYKVPQKDKIQLTIYNVAGQEVIVLIDEEKDEGFYSVRWNGSDKYGKSSASGIYFYTFRAGDFFSCKKLVLLK